MNELQKMKLRKQTENGDVSYKSTGDNLADILFMTAYLEKHLDEVKIGTSETEKLFSMYIRDPRFGMGRRALGRELLRQSQVTPEWIVKCGRYDDLLEIATDECLNKIKEDAMSGNELAKKWLPRLTNKDKEVAKMLCKMWGMKEKEYRKLIKANTTEYKLSYAEESKEDNRTPLDDLFKKNKYVHPLVNEIKFEEVPSMAMTKYLHAFSTREDIKERFSEYIENVKENKAKINTKTANVHDAMKVAVQNDWCTQEVHEEAKEVLSSKIIEQETLGVEMDAIVVLDTSGSMYRGWGINFNDMEDIGMKAMSVAYAIASKSTYARNQIISFSSNPHLMEIKGETMGEKYRSMYTGDCSNTDLKKVMNLLKGLKKYPQYIIIMSDMEFDYGSCYSKDELMRYFKENAIPTKLIWWTFNDRNATSPEIDEFGNYYLSGYNIQNLRLLNNQMNMEELINEILRKYKKDIDYVVS